jgi:hypothetical protein
VAPGESTEGPANNRATEIDHSTAEPVLDAHLPAIASRYVGEYKTKAIWGHPGLPSASCAIPRAIRAIPRALVPGIDVADRQGTRASQSAPDRIPSGDSECNRLLTAVAFLFARDPFLIGSLIGYT